MWRQFVGSQINYMRGDHCTLTPCASGLCTCSQISVHCSWMVLLVKTRVAPGVGQGNKFMPSTKASFNLLQRWLRTIGQHYLWSLEPLHYDPLLFRRFFCFSVEVYNYPFLGYELPDCGEATHTRTSYN